MTQMGVMVWGGDSVMRKGIYVYIQLSHFVVQQKLTQHCKAVILQQKQNVLGEGKRNQLLETLMNKVRGMLRISCWIWR